MGRTCFVFGSVLLLSQVLGHVSCSPDGSADIVAEKDDIAVDVGDPSSGQLLFTIEGKVTPPDPKPEGWYWQTRILVDGGRLLGFLKSDNTFVVSGLTSPGSYVVQVSSPDHQYEVVRVDITSKGKVRARKVNNIQPSHVSQVPYPLKLKVVRKINYFLKRDEWKVSDLLMNPMILMMVLPLLLIAILPKLMSDPETQKEMQTMQRSMQLQQSQIPEASEVMAHLFGGEKTKEKPKKKTSNRVPR